MKTMKTVGKKPMMKAKKGRTVSKVVDPEGNTIKTRTNENTGRTVTVVKYKDKESSGKRKEKTVTPGLTRFEKKANEMYQANPKAAEEDDFKPFTPKAKYGANVKSKSVKPKAMYGTSMKPSMMEKGGITKAKYGKGVVSTADASTYTRAGKKIGSGMGKSAEYRDFTTGEGDRSYGSMAEKMKLRKENKKASASGKIQIQRKGGAVRKSKLKK